MIRVPLGDGRELPIASEGRHWTTCRSLVMQTSAANNPMYVASFAIFGHEPFKQHLLLPAGGASRLRLRDIYALARLFDVTCGTGRLPWLDTPKAEWAFNPDDFRDQEAEAYVVVEPGRDGWGPRNKLLLGRGARR